MNITIHRGTTQIGGCVTEYEQDGWKVFVDFGEQLPGHKSVVDDLKIEGLTHGDTSKSILLITHYHGDHIGKLCDIADSVKVYMGQYACEIYQKLQLRLSFIKGKPGEMARTAYERTKKINTFLDGNIISFGPFEIRPIKMDHSAFDAYGFVIQTENETDLGAFHTGDFRCHGLYTEDFYDAFETVGEVTAIVCEGTNIEREDSSAKHEYKILEEFTEQFKKNKYNSVFVSSTNIDRIFGIYRAAREAGRLVFMDEFQFDILQTVLGQSDWMGELDAVHTNEDEADADIILPDARYTFDLGQPYVLKLDRFSRSSPSFYIPDTLRDYMLHKGCVIIARSTPQFTELIDSLPAEQSRKYLSMWKGYLDSSSPAFNQSLASAIGDEYEYIHTSGHADFHTLEQLFWSIQHDVIIPMHTSNPQMFLSMFEDQKVTVIEDGKTYSLEELSAPYVL